MSTDLVEGYISVFTPPNGTLLTETIPDNELHLHISISQYVEGDIYNIYMAKEYIPSSTDYDKWIMIPTDFPVGWVSLDTGGDWNFYIQSTYSDATIWIHITSYNDSEYEYLMSISNIETGVTDDITDTIDDTTSTVDTVTDTVTDELNDTINVVASLDIGNIENILADIQLAINEQSNRITEVVSTLQSLSTVISNNVADAIHEAGSDIQSELYYLTSQLWTSADYISTQILDGLSHVGEEISLINEYMYGNIKSAIEDSLLNVYDATIKLLVDKIIYYLDNVINMPERGWSEVRDFFFEPIEV